MIDIVSDNPEIQSNLERLIVLITNNGGRFSSDIQIISSGGELSINSILSRRNSDEIIYIPASCLPSIQDFDMSLEGDNLIVKPHKNRNVSELHLGIMKLMIDLFNLTEKIRYHRRTSPVIALINCPDIIDHLQRGSLYEIKVQIIPGLSDKVVSSFIRTRWFKFGIGTEMRMVILPIIDCINHHHDGRPFRTDGPEFSERGVSIFNSKPVFSSDECFVRYSVDNDVLNMYIKYGFVDVYASMPHSIPLFIKLGAVGTLKINRIFKQKPPLGKDVSEKNILYPKDLHNYFPEIIGNKNNVLEVSGLIIPSKEVPFSLRGILKILIHILLPTIEKEYLFKCISYAEEMVLKENFSYYYKLQNLSENIPHEINVSSELVESLSLLAQIQMKRLSEWKERLAS